MPNYTPSSDVVCRLGKVSKKALSKDTVCCLLLKSLK